MKNKEKWNPGRDRLYFIAEAGVNHNGSLELAKSLIEVAKQANADAIKFQTFSAERLVTKIAPSAEYQKSAGEGSTQFEMLKRLELSANDFQVLCDYCLELGLEFISTPFDEESADLLDEIGVSIYKVSSGDLTNLDLLAHIAAKGKPMIISTGMANMAETERAVQTLKNAGNDQFAILHCVSNYPARPDQANLRAMATLGHAFKCPVGWSDHMQGNAISLAATACGAQIIEKHFTMDRNMPGPDHAASLEPDELKALIKGVRDVEAAMGTGVKWPTEPEAEIALVARRSITADCDIKKGTVLTRSMLSMRRPGDGIEPYLTPMVVGRVARADISAGQTIKLDHLC